jgi:hypothetical protein
MKFIVWLTTARFSWFALLVIGLGTSIYLEYGLLYALIIIFAGGLCEEVIKSLLRGDYP